MHIYGAQICHLFMHKIINSAGGPAVENGDLFSLINRNQLLLWRDQPFILCWGTLRKMQIGTVMLIKWKANDPFRRVYYTLSNEGINDSGCKWKKKNNSFFFFCSFITLWILSHKTEQETSYWPVAEFSQKISVLKLLFLWFILYFSLYPSKQKVYREYLYFTVNVFYIWYLKNIKSKWSPHKVRNKL